jgi:hypothetical protein
MAVIHASTTALGVAAMAFNAHREAMQDTAVLMLAYITLHEKLKLGELTDTWHSIGGRSDG